MQTTSQCGTCSHVQQATEEFEKRGWHVFLMAIGAIRVSTTQEKSRPETSTVGAWHCSLA